MSTWMCCEKICSAPRKWKATMLSWCHCNECIFIALCFAGCRILCIDRNLFMVNHSHPAWCIAEKVGWYLFWVHVKIKSRTWCDCLLHVEFHSSDMKVSDKHVYVYLYLTNSYDFVSTCQNNNVLKHNITTEHWWDMSSLQKKCSLSVTLHNVKTVEWSPYEMHKYKRNRSDVWIVVLSILCTSNFSIQSFWWWWWWFLFCSDWRYVGLLF